MEVPFFEVPLKGEGGDKGPKASVFETGTNRWRKFDAWPPKDAKPSPLHFRMAGALNEQPYDNTGSTIDLNPVDEFTSDPAKPVPFISKTVINMAQEYMTADQR